MSVIGSGHTTLQQVDLSYEILVPGTGTTSWRTISDFGGFTIFVGRTGWDPPRLVPSMGKDLIADKENRLLWSHAIHGQPYVHCRVVIVPVGGCDLSVRISQLFISKRDEIIRCI